MNTAGQYLVLSEYYRLADLEQFKGQVKAGDVIPVPLFPIGNWKSAKYPDLPLTQELADEVIANFAAHVLGTDPVIDSSGRHDSSAPAAAWTKRLTIEPTKDGGSLLVAWSELTDVGANDLNNGRYRYASVEIGSHVDNVTGDVTKSVYRGATFTNTPVLRIMPAVLETAAAIAASEQHLAIALTEDPGDHAEPIDGSSDAASQPAKADEGQDVVLADGDAATKGSDPMNPKTLKTLKLAEGASDEAVEAAVLQLSEERDTAVTERNAAVTQLAATEKTGAIAAFTIKLDEKIKTENTVAPGQRDYFLGLADRNMVEAELSLASHTVKVIDVAEHGTGNEGDGKSTKRADVELSELSRARMVKDGIDYPKAVALTLSENHNEIQERYQNFLDGKEG